MPSHFDSYRQHSVYRALRLLAQQKPVLFHGTRYGSKLDESNAIILPELGQRCVSLTRDPAVALHFAQLERDNGADCGHVYVLDRERLATRYKIKPRTENWWGFREEAEEAIWRPITSLSSFVVDVVEVRSSNLGN